MKLTRIYTGDDGHSHFEEVDLVEDPTQRRSTTETRPATYFGFGITTAMLPMQEWHHAPRRQLVAVLSGALEIECADGKRVFGTGDCFIADDLAGRGHQTSDIEGPVRLLYVHLP